MEPFLDRAEPRVGRGQDRRTAMTRLAYLTSCRELAHVESAGHTVIDPVTGASLGYRMCLVEEICRALTRGDDSALGQVGLVGVFTDDDPAEVEHIWCGRPPWRSDLRVPAHAQRAECPIEALTHHLSSLSYRALVRAKAPAALRAEAKAAFEARLLRALREARADVLVCDSYMLILSENFLRSFPGLVLNIHPGITDPKDQGWLPGATPTRDAFTRARYGYVIVDDKHAVPHPAGRAIRVEYEGRLRDAIDVGVIGRSGVTCHRVTAIVDGGPIVSEAIYNFDPARASEEQIRTWNYPLKLPVLTAALHVLGI